MKQKIEPVVLIIADGLALNPEEKGNAFKAAVTPVFDDLFASRPNSCLKASGEAVGLMETQMGDSNVGHLNIGAGRIVYQYVLRILNDIRDGKFFENEVLCKAMEEGAKRGRLHFMGLVSPGGVHSHTQHLLALLSMAKKAKIENVFVHAFTDGRDVSPSSGESILKDLENKMQENDYGDVATVIGRYYAMDRDQRWDRTEKAYKAMVLGEGIKTKSGVEAVNKAYERGESDEFVKPTVIVDGDGRPKGNIHEGDAVLFFNFRADRARQMTKAFTEKNFNGFFLPGGAPKVHFTCLSRYDEEYNVPYAYKPLELVNTLGEVISNNGLKQLRAAETEKYAHVTFFLNGGQEVVFSGESRKMIPSPKVATYDLKPEMSAYEVTDTVIEEIEKDEHHLIIMNYANCDIVGHTGIVEAALKAVSTVDTCVGKMIDAVQKTNGAVLLTADHGNVEQMLDYDSGEEHTFHTSYPVPAIYIGPDRSIKKMRDGCLADIAPTILDMMHIEKPKEMTGESLFIR